MFPFSHFFGGFLVGMVFQSAGLIEISATQLILFGFFSVIPDIDSFWNRKLEEHHASPLHTPILWLITSSLVVYWNFNLALVILASTLFHILCDAITGRTSGVQLLFPLTTNEYRISNKTLQTGDLDPINPEREKLKKHFKLYLQNTKLTMFETTINLTGITSLIILTPSL